MFKYSALCFFLGVVVFSNAAVVKRAAAGKIRGCYLTNWAQYRPAPGKWDFNNYVPGVCTHIFYAFAKVTGSTAAPTDPSDLTKGYAELKKLKEKQPDLKLIISFGGASDDTFPAADPNVYAKAAVEFAKKNGFDGVDIDWEFPTAATKDKFATLIQAVKKAAGNLLVTAAVSANADNAAQIYDFAKLKTSLDFLNIMAYDFHGTWDAVTGANAPLKGEGKFTVDYLAQFYKKNFPAEKILLGIPTYGRGWTLATSAANQKLGAPATGGSAQLTATATAGVAAYYEVCKLGGTEGYDATSETPFAQKGNQWFTFDNEKSVAAKTQYAKTNNFGGVFVWTLDMDDSTNACGKGKFPLLESIKKALA